MRGRDDIFFALHLIVGGKLDICERAALGFKFFSNAALRVKSLLTPGLTKLLLFSQVK